MPSPRDEYEGRLQHCHADAARLAAAERRLARGRLIVFGIGLLAAWLALDRALLPMWAPALPAFVFVGLVLVHDRTIRAGRRAERAREFFAAGLARIADTWAGSGRTGDAFVDPAHPYAADLDLFGPGSLFELLCTARTQPGEATLAAWLCAPAAVDTVRARHRAVDELRPRLDLREEIAVLGEEARGAVAVSTLEAWAARPPRRMATRGRVVLATLPVITLLALAACYGGVIGPSLALGAGTVQLGLAIALRGRVAYAARAADSPAHHLALLAELLTRIEREPFQTPRMVALRAALESQGQAPSQRIARLRRLVELLDAYRNPFFAPIGALLMWRTNFALAIEAWHAASGAAVSRWLAVIGEFEALSALASYAYEHPDDPFPEFATARAPCFDGTALGHPLIPSARCVRNDVRLGGGLQVMIVSGSNMSGKSTLLRTVGVNAVLAFAGAPVRAGRLRLTPLAAGASLRIVDSLQDGTSRFYAELKRLRQITDIARGPLPLLFLLDEILSGTNSHDRAVGAEAVVRRLVEQGAIGLVTTHDLTLARIADALGPRAVNVHFQDHLEDGRMVFDYRVHPGVVQRSNALALMRAVGLEV